MLGHRPAVIWKYIWVFVTPSLLIFAITLQIVGLKPIEYGSQVFPKYASNIGWCLTSISLLPIPIYAIYKLVCFKRSAEGCDVPLKRALVTLTAPAADWGPALTKYRCVGQQYDEDDVFAWMFSRCHSRRPVNHKLYKKSRKSSRRYLANIADWMLPCINRVKQFTLIAINATLSIAISPKMQQRFA